MRKGHGVVHRRPSLVHRFRTRAWRGAVASGTHVRTLSRDPEVRQAAKDIAVLGGLYYGVKRLPDVRKRTLLYVQRTFPPGSLMHGKALQALMHDAATRETTQDPLKKYLRKQYRPEFTVINRQIPPGQPGRLTKTPNYALTAEDRKLYEQAHIHARAASRARRLARKEAWKNRTPRARTRIKAAYKAKAEQVIAGVRERMNLKKLHGPEWRKVVRRATLKRVGKGLLFGAAAAAGGYAAWRYFRKGQRR